MYIAGDLHFFYTKYIPELNPPATDKPPLVSNCPRRFIKSFTECNFVCFSEKLWCSPGKPN